MPLHRVLITGANGHVGGRLARRLLEEGVDQLLLWLHADSVEQFAQKQARLVATLQDHVPRLSFAWGDLRSVKPFASIEPSSITHIIHVAAVTRFNIDADLARDVNQFGTAKLLEFARRCKRLENVALLSTIYAAGLRSGDVVEAPLDGEAGFSNHYEASKWAAEHVLLSQYADLPWQILRIATVIADEAESGRVSQQNAFHNTLKLLYHGLLPVIPGTRETPMYFVTSDFIANAVARVLRSGAQQQIFHVAHTQAESLSLGELLDTAFSSFEADAGFRRRRVMFPLFVDETAFSRLAASLEEMSGEVIRQSVASVRPFAKQLYLHKSVHNTHLVSQCPGYAAPDPYRLIERVCRHLLHTRWGREAQPIWNPQSF